MCGRTCTCDVLELATARREPVRIALLNMMSELGSECERLCRFHSERKGDAERRVGICVDAVLLVEGEAKLPDSLPCQETTVHFT